MLNWREYIGKKYFVGYRGKTFLSENFLDSVLILADISLSYDDQLAEAYVIRGDYYFWGRSNKEKAIIEYDKAISLNPNDGHAYQRKGWLYNFDELVETLDNFHKAASLNRGPGLPTLYSSLGTAYAQSGFKEKAIYYTKEALKLDDDSASYYYRLGDIEETNGNFEKAIEFLERSYTIDSTKWWVMRGLGTNHMFLSLKEESLEYYKKYF